VDVEHAVTPHHGCEGGERPPRVQDVLDVEAAEERDVVHLFQGDGAQAGDEGGQVARGGRDGAGGRAAAQGERWGGDGGDGGERDSVGHGHVLRGVAG